MALKRVVFDDGIVKDSGIALAYSQSSATVDEVGSAVLANVPRYAGMKLLCGAPVPTRRRTSGDQWVWGGRAQSGDPRMLLMHKTSAGVYSLEVHTTTFDASPLTYSITGSSGNKDDLPDLLLGSGSTYGEDANKREEPRCAIVCDGAIVVFCDSFVYDSGNWLSATASACRWNPAANGGSGRWELVTRLPEIQRQTLSVVRHHGAEWMATGPWCSEAREAGIATDFFVVWTDYIGNFGPPIEGAYGGQLAVLRATWNPDTSSWVYGNNRVVYKEDYPAPEPAEGMHFHSGGLAIFGEDPDQAMSLLLCVGDSNVNRTVVIARDDLDYTEGQSDANDQTPAAANPTPENHFPPDVPSASDGWTTYEDSEGQRVRISIRTGATPAVYDKPNKRLSHATAFANFDPPAGPPTGRPTVLAWFWTNPSDAGDKRRGAIGVTGVVDSQTIQLERELPYYVNDEDHVTGYMYSDESMQAIAQVPTDAMDTIILGCDESTNAIVRVKVGPYGEKVRPEHLYGVPPDHSPSLLRTKFWNCFLITCALPREGRHYAALVKPGTLSEDGWQDDANAAVILYSPDGQVWGQMWQPVSTNWTPSAFFGTSKYFVGSINSVQRLTEIDMPVYVQARPISISGGGTNLLRQVIGEGAPAIDVVQAPDYGLPSITGGYTTVTELGPLDLPDLEPDGDVEIPHPPCLGPIMRLTAFNLNTFGVWQLTNSASLTIPEEGPRYYPKGRVKFWVYVLPPAKTPATANEQPTASPGAVLRFTFGWGIDHIVSDPVDLTKIIGRGWVPFTLAFDASDWSSPESIPSEFALHARVDCQGTVFSRQDILIAFDSVTAASGVETPRVSQPSAALPVGDTLDDDLLNITYTTVLGLNTWSLYAAFRIPDNGADIFSAAEDSLPPLSAFTVHGASGKKLTVSLDRINNRIVLTDDSSHTINLQASADAAGFTQPFYFLRGRQVLLAIAKSGTTVTAWASVGGSQIYSASNSSMNDVKLVNIKPGDASGGNIDSLEYFAFCVENSTAISDSTARTALKTLNFF